MKKNYPYLKDTDFMYLADTQNLQNQFVRLILLDWNENPLEEIQGIATGGSISINGNSAIRRTCNLSITIQDISTGKITDAKNLISINKKVYIEIGIVNKTNKYKDYNILWYPQGTFIFTQCNVNVSLDQGISLSAQLKDKMCLLNGECGGVITSAVTLDTYDILDDTTGKIITLRPTIAKIIRELVNHFGKEQLGKIIINDIEEQIKMVMRWTGNNPLYLATKDSSHLFTTSYTEAENFGGTIQEFQYNQDVGFIYTDFIWADNSLLANYGDSVCTILDKIKNFLGNYEYYYDIDGNFIFQEIKNYLNTTQASIDLRNMNNNNYIVDMFKGKSIYDFSNSKLITSFSNDPQYNKIKNDFVVWGIKEATNEIKLPIRYHLAIDTKPEIGNIYEVFFYNDPDDGLKKAKVPIKYENRAHFPEVGVEGLFYLDNNTQKVYKWNSNLQTYVAPDGRQYIEYNDINDFPLIGNSEIIYVDTSEDSLYIWVLNPDTNQGQYNAYHENEIVHVQATDWRSELYLSGAAAEPLGLESNYYYSELEVEWPKLYNLQANSYIDDETGYIIYTGAFYEDIINNPWNVDYWLDFIDSNASISQFNISNIGRRSIVKNSNNYNCIFESSVPDIVIIESGQKDTQEKREECENRNQDYCQVSSNIYDALAIGGMNNSCFNEIKNLLWENTNYNSSINISLIPIYHLEPNTRITVHSNEADIHGDFIIQSMSIPLDINGTMNISATQVQTKL